MTFYFLAEVHPVLSHFLQLRNEGTHINAQLFAHGRIRVELIFACIEGNALDGPGAIKKPVAGPVLNLVRLTADQRAAVYYLALSYLRSEGVVVISEDGYIKSFQGL
jgi:hypothetical protein